ncbi:MAG: M24 family metallopeptidase [Hyphomicrobiaceae bacterium]
MIGDAMDKHLHFDVTEFESRRSAACQKMRDRDLDALLMFRQESMYYLTGYDTFGYTFFQCLVMTANGRCVLLTRAPDLRQAKFTSTLEDIRVWIDGADSDPSVDLHDLLQELGLRNAQLGVEYDSHGLTAHSYRLMARTLDGFATMNDASRLVSELRLVKSPAEVAYVRRAAELGDAAWAAAVAAAAPGVSEADILADMHSAIFRGGGDDPANEFIIGSGPGALMCRYYSGRRRLDQQDQLTLEFAGAYRHYHSALMRTMAIGQAPQRQNDLYAAATDALLACEDRLRPGCTVGEVFQAHADTLDAAGLQQYRLNACGYSLGTTYAPCWMDWPMIFADNPVVLQPGMVFFLHMIIFDDDAGLAATNGRTSLVTSNGAEPLSAAGLDLVVK